MTITEHNQVLREVLDCSKTEAARCCILSLEWIQYLRLEMNKGQITVNLHLWWRQTQRCQEINSNYCTLQQNNINISKNSHKKIWAFLRASTSWVLTCNPVNAKRIAKTVSRWSGEWKVITMRNDRNNWIEKEVGAVVDSWARPPSKHQGCQRVSC